MSQKWHLYGDILSVNQAHKTHVTVLHNSQGFIKNEVYAIKTLKYVAFNCPTFHTHTRQSTSYSSDMIYLA